MNDQHKFQPYEATPLFADGRGMQSPPLGHRPARSRRRPPRLHRRRRRRHIRRRDPGAADAASSVDGPLRLRDLLRRLPRPRRQRPLRRSRATWSCASRRRSSPSRCARFPAGRIFQVATDGYGLMPSYAIELSTRERWAVVAWLRALQLSQIGRARRAAAAAAQRRRARARVARQGLLRSGDAMSTMRERRDDRRDRRTPRRRAVPRRRAHHRRRARRRRARRRRLRPRAAAPIRGKRSPATSSPTSSSSPSLIGVIAFVMGAHVMSAALADDRSPLVRARVRRDAALVVVSTCRSSGRRAASIRGRIPSASPIITRARSSSTRWP